MNKFVLAVLVDGKFQKELANGTVNIPFGAEFKLRLRNKNSRRAVAKVFVDGENISGGGFIVPNNDFIEIERPVDVNKKFKFVSLESGEAIDFGKNGPNNDKIKGLIEVRWHFEVDRVQHITSYVSTIPSEHPPKKNICRYINLYCKSVGSDSTQSSGFQTSNHMSMIDDPKSNSKKNSFLSQLPINSSIADNVPAENLKDGCTVEGNVSHDQYILSRCSYESDFVTTKVFLQGFNPGEVPECMHVAPVTNTSQSPKQNQPVEESLTYKLQNERLEVMTALLELYALREQNAKLKLELAKREIAKLEALSA